MSLLLFYRSNYWIRRKPEYVPEQPRKRKKRVYKVLYNRAKAEALPVNLKVFATDIRDSVRHSITKKRQQEEDVLILLNLLDDL